MKNNFARVQDRVELTSSIILQTPVFPAQKIKSYNMVGLDQKIGLRLNKNNEKTLILERKKKKRTQELKLFEKILKILIIFMGLNLAHFL